MVFFHRFGAPKLIKLAFNLPGDWRTLTSPFQKERSVPIFEVLKIIDFRPDST